jgi:hypothetical protein
MTVNAKNPSNVRGNLRFQTDNGARDLVEFVPSFRLEIGLAGIEEDFRLEDEAIALNAHVGSIAEHLAQFTEKVRAVARQFLNVLRQRNIQPLAEIADALLGLRFLFGGDIKRGV